MPVIVHRGKPQGVLHQLAVVVLVAGAVVTAVALWRHTSRPVIPRGPLQVALARSTARVVERSEPGFTCVSVVVGTDPEGADSAAAARRTYAWVACKDRHDAEEAAAVTVTLRGRPHVEGMDDDTPSGIPARLGYWRDHEPAALGDLMRRAGFADVSAHD